MRSRLAFLPVLAAGALLLWAPAAGASQHQVAFERGGEIWISHGTHQRQITAGDGDASEPAFFPGGRSIVFSRRLDASRAQLYTVSVQGGVERPVFGAGAWAVSPTVSRTGLIAYLGARSFDSARQLRTIRVEGGRRQILVRPDPGAVLRSPRFTADGRRIHYRVCRETRRGGRRCATALIRSS